MIWLIEQIDRNALWLYLGLGVFGLIQLVRFIQAERTMTRAPYNFVREVAGGVAAQSGALLLVTVLLAGVVFATAFWVAPNIPVIFNVPPTLTPITPPTPEPTATSPVVIPGLVTPTPAESPTPAATRTPVPVGGANCSNLAATISSPLPGAVLGGEVEVVGTADIPNFAFYVMEISTLGDNWLVVYTGSTPVRNGVLGVWNASLQTPGDYAFRLAVFDATGAGPAPCTIPISIGVSED